MTCATCGRENPAHLTFCQECGQRLGPRIAPPTPPIGLGVEESAMGAPAPAPPRNATSLGMTQIDPPRTFTPLGQPAQTGAPKRCKVCDTVNAATLRYCTSCGSNLDPVPGAASAPAPAPAPAAAPPPAPAPPPAAIAPAPVLDLGRGGGSAPAVRTCSRCRGVVDSGAQFCKFCGASLADSGAPPRASGNGAPPPQPVAVAKPIAPPTPLAAFAPAGVGPLPSPSPIGGDASSPSAYGPPPPMPKAPSASPPDAAPAYGPPPVAPPPAPVPAVAPPAPPPAPAPKPATIPSRGRLVVIAKSGADGPSYPFGDTLDVGRTEGHVIIGEDPYLSPRHVRIAHVNGKVVLRDLGSTNGVYLRLAAARHMDGPSRAGSEVAVPLQDQDLILVGQQVLRFDVLREAENGLGAASEHGTLLFGSPASPRYARLAQRTVEGVTRDVYYLRKMETVLGRESGDVVFTEDPFLSRRHAAIRALGRDGTALPATAKPSEIARFALVDLGSSNGTFLRIRNEVELKSGDQFRVGQQLFRVDIGASATGLTSQAGPQGPREA